MSTIPTDLSAPFQKCMITQLRTSKMQPMKNLSITTGIYKQPISTSRIYCSLLGLTDDEHDPTFHGGVDKAILQYYPGHYEAWKEDFEEGDEVWEVGGFGENFVADGGMNERNVCIGDTFSVGGEVVLQVSLPRQPCFKLNHRFNKKAFASQTWKKSRTGWYYRVLKEGWIAVGDEIVLLERKHPKWTIERVQEYLHRDKTNLEKLEELSRIEEFGNECKKAFKKSIEQEKVKRQGKVKEVWREFKVVEKKYQTPRIASFLLQLLSDELKNPKIEPGSFARLKLPNGLIRTYSIVHGNADRFQLGIALDDHSRGGSKYLHEVVKEGDKILVGKITPSVPMTGSASNHIFIVGGIGLTAFLDHTGIFNKINYNYEFHYAVRSKDELPFPEQLAAMGSKLILYDRSQKQRMDILNILKTRKWNSFIYTCGPPRMTAEVSRAVTELEIPEDEVHYEAFGVDIGGDPFEVELRSDKKVLNVGGEQTLLEVLREAGLEVDSSCEAGNCGTCKVDVCEGKIEHRGSALSEEDKKSGMLSCVSRGIGRIVLGL